MLLPIDNLDERSNMRFSFRVLEKYFLPSDNAMSALATQHVDEFDGSPEGDSATNILSPGGHEIPILLSLTADCVRYPFGSLHDDLKSSPPFLIRLGTRVSDNHPSCIGFRIMVRNTVSNPQPIEAMEDAYHVKSFKYKPDGKKTLHHSAASIDDLLDIGATTSPDSRSKIQLYRIDFEDVFGAFEETCHGTEPDTSIADVSRVLEIVKCLNRCQKLSLFFMFDHNLINLLEETIRRGCKGSRDPVWSDVLPSSLVPSWPSNNQTRMVSGSSNIVNVLQRGLREPVLDDAPVTALNARPKAGHFKTLVEKLFPSLRREPNHKLSPIMLNVHGGRCFELPFGGSMLNPCNSYATLNILHKMLDSGLASTDIGIVAFYPTQVQCYEIALANLHRYDSQRGYNFVKVATLDDWANQEVDFAIVDLVRTSNASGNLGFLSQARRVKIALTLHRNGLIIVGNRSCTINAEGKILCTKLEKVFKWLEDNDRIIDMNENGDPIHQMNQEVWREHAENLTKQSFPHLAPESAGPAAPVMKRYVGIPDLERDLEKLRNTLPAHAASNINFTLNDVQLSLSASSILSQASPAKDPSTKQFQKIPTSDKVAASSSFARQAALLSTPGDVQQGDNGPPSIAGRTADDRKSRAQSTEATATPSSSPVSTPQATPRAIIGTAYAGHSPCWQQAQKALDAPLSARSTQAIPSNPDTPNVAQSPAQKNEQSLPSLLSEGRNSDAIEHKVDTTVLTQTERSAVGLRRLLEKHTKSNRAQNMDNAITPPHARAAAKPIISAAIKTAKKPREIPEEDQGKRPTPITPITLTSPVSKEGNTAPRAFTATLPERLRQQTKDIRVGSNNPGSTAPKNAQTPIQKGTDAVQGLSQPIFSPLVDRSNLPNQPAQRMALTSQQPFAHQFLPPPSSTTPQPTTLSALFPASPTALLPLASPISTATLPLSCSSATIFPLSITTTRLSGPLSAQI